MVMMCHLFDVALISDSALINTIPNPNPNHSVTCNIEILPLGTGLTQCNTVQYNEYIWSSWFPTLTLRNTCRSSRWVGVLYEAYNAIVLSMDECLSGGVVKMWSHARDPVSKPG